jgi:hypothetical protein
MLPKCENLIPMVNQLIEDVHNGSNYTTITTAGAGYKDVVGFHSDKQGSNMQCTVSLFVCGGGDHCQSS